MQRTKKLSRKQFISTYGSLIGLILLVIVITILRPRFVSPANLRNVFRNASINGLLAIGMTFVVLTGGIDLSVGAIMGCAGMYSAYFALGCKGISCYCCCFNRFNSRTCIWCFLMEYVLPI